jgi:hypothetical protein
MADRSSLPRANESFFATPWVGTLFTVLSGLSFLLLCMILPLVGKAAAATTHAQPNRTAFLVVLIAATVLAGLATVSKFERRKIDGSPRPFFSMLLMALCVFLMAALFLGLLQK